MKLSWFVRRSNSTTRSNSGSRTCAGLGSRLGCPSPSPSPRPRLRTRRPPFYPSFPRLARRDERTESHHHAALVQEAPLLITPWRRRTQATLAGRLGARTTRGTLSTWLGLGLGLGVRVRVRVRVRDRDRDRARVSTRGILRTWLGLGLGLGFVGFGFGLGSPSQPPRLSAGGAA